VKFVVNVTHVKRVQLSGKSDPYIRFFLGLRHILLSMVLYSKEEKVFVEKKKKHGQY